MFYSVQGEGPTSGTPAYFMRLQGCNLDCGFCDTTEVWKRGERKTNSELVQKLKDDGQLANILTGKTHVVWTGGEPALPHHQKGITDFLSYLETEYPGSPVYNELETNGTLALIPEMTLRMNQINCSPKLSNSGEPKEKRIVPYVINQIKNMNSTFKFVVSNESDIDELKDDYVFPFNLFHKQVILMPEVTRLKDLSDRTRFVYDMAKKYGYRATTRGQVLAWDKTTGV